ncbi:MAG TPA: ATP synthase subunit I [Halanaerobiales bacterium]|nr:ATP synthase subunit I [Halanaerobiales bacterium]HPZ62447.1 ATP synthase subunit I [Halanaerobiales bacterium]HQD03671.1 ATP synthase subunit I [Halanaerobiales bacterium]
MIFKEEPEKLVLVLSKRSMYIGLIISVSALFSGNLAVAVGILYGLAISLLLFRLKFLQVQKALGMDESGASRYIRTRYYINYLIYGMVLTTAHKNERLNFFAVAAGLLILKFVIFGSAALYYVKEKWTNTISSLEEGRD